MTFFESITDFRMEGQLPKELSRDEGESDDSFLRKILFESIMEGSQVDLDRDLVFAHQTFSIGECRIHIRRRLKRFEFRNGITDIIDISDCYVTGRELENIQRIVDSSNIMRIYARGSVVEGRLDLNWKRVDGFDARFSCMDEVRFNNANFTDVVNFAHGKYGCLKG